MGAKLKQLEIDADLAVKLGEVLAALKISKVKVRALTFDIGNDWGPRHRVRIGGEMKARWHHGLVIKSIERLDG